MSGKINTGFSVKQAKWLEYGIIGLCAFALFCIFQPFSQFLFSAGCIGVVVGGLVFNLMPFCVAGESPRKLIKVGGIVLFVFAIAVALALASAWGYGLYLKTQ
ncbi:MAG: hypothetical protein V7701_05220 [Sneathiella sp.]